MLQGILDSGDSTISSGSVLYVDAAQLRSYPGSGTIWTDLTANANTLALYNGAVFTGSVGGNIFFDGTNDGVSGSNASVYTITNNISIEVWGNFRTSGNLYVMGKGPSNGVTNEFPGNYELQLQVNNSLQFMHQTSTTAGNSNFQYFTTTTNVYSNNTWTHIVATSNGTTTTIYTNGTARTTTRFGTVGNIVSTNSQPIRIGRRADGAVMPGSIAIVRIYNRILSSNEVLQNYNFEKSRFGL
jgi:hypothetical protein